MIVIINAIQLWGKISGMWGQLDAKVTFIVTSLYSLKIEEMLLCLQQIAALLNDDSWIGK